MSEGQTRDVLPSEAINGDLNQLAETLLNARYIGERMAAQVQSYYPRNIPADIIARAMEELEREGLRQARLARKVIETLLTGPV